MHLHCPHRQNQELLSTAIDSVSIVRKYTEQVFPGVGFGSPETRFVGDAGERDREQLSRCACVDRRRSRLAHTASHHCATEWRNGAESNPYRSSSS
jgi:hypothetical protein